MNLIQRLKNLSPRAKVFLWITLAVVVADQVTKYLAIAHLTKAFDIAGPDLGFFGKLWQFISYRHPPRGDVIALSESFFHLRYVENPGAAWGFLSGAAQWFRTPFFLLVALGAMIFIVAYFRKTTAEQKVLRVALALVFGGAVGNFVDRVRLGYVIDFIDWHWYDRFTWPTFNIADAGISVGVGLLILDMILHRTSETTDATRRSDRELDSKVDGTVKRAGSGA